MPLSKLYNYGRRRWSRHLEKSTKSIKTLDCILQSLNLILFLASSAILGVGLWLVLKDFNLIQISSVFGEEILVKCFLYLGICSAGVAVIVSMIFCCGIKQNCWGLGVFASILFTLTLTFAATAVLSGLFHSNLGSTESKFHLKDRLLQFHGLPGSSKKSSEVTRGWDMMQKTLSCCGAFGDINSTTSWAVYRESDWFRSLPDDNLVHVPESCCVLNRNTDICQKGDPKLFGPPLYGPPMREHFNHINPHLNTDGCYQKVTNYLLLMTILITAVAGSMAILFLLVAILTCKFCIKVKHEQEDENEEYEYTDFPDAKSTKPMMPSAPSAPKGAAEPTGEMTHLKHSDPARWGTPI